MSQKRMFDRAIIDTDRFMDLPLSAKALYFLLGMEADDEGFVSYKKVTRIHGGTEDDTKILVAKGFLLMFKSGVVVITDWNKNNYLDKNRIRQTEYKKEKEMLHLTSDNKYEFNTCLTSIEESSIEEGSIEENNQSTEKSVQGDKLLKNSEPESKDIQEFIKLFEIVNPTYERLFKNKTERESSKQLLKKYGKEKMFDIVSRLPELIIKPFYPKITTPYQLERDLGKLIAIIKQDSTKNSSKIAFS